jgi:hydroxymethylglutaryl-CoA lyase
MGAAARSVTIREVGPRDGFQNESELIGVEDKVRLVEALGRTGLRRIEVTSFVRPDLIPQLADGAEVLARAQLPAGVARSVLVPNARGLEKALASREHFDEVALFLSATDSHNKANVNRTTEESLSELEALIPQVREAGLRPTTVIAVAFGCPYEGAVAVERVVEIGKRLAAAGIAELGLGDTTGMANPADVPVRFGALAEALPGVELTAHFHNTRGQGLANVLAALNAGVTSFESSFGEIGGCPVPPGSTGNIATEDLVSMLEEMGVATGVDLAALLAASADLQTVLGRPLGSHTLVAGPVEWHRG